MLKELSSLCKRRGIVWPSSEIYGGLRGLYDFGPIGTELKRNIRSAWWSSVVTKHTQYAPPSDAPGAYSVYGVETSVIMNPQVWRVSGHADQFSDLMVDCRETKQRYRCDHIFGRWYDAGGERAFVTVAGDTSDPGSAVSERANKALPKIFGKNVKIKLAADKQPLTPLTEVDKYEEVLGPDASMLGTLTPPRQFNLMIRSQIGAVESEVQEVFLRPETAQGMFVNFRNAVDTVRARCPFGLAQVGRSFRNEVTPRHFLFRIREFEQMEMEFFVHPSESHSWYEFWKKHRYKWYIDHGMSSDRLRMREHEKGELSHYAKATCDVEYAFPFLAEGEYGELEGIAHRGEFDLLSHMKGKLTSNMGSLEVALNESGEPQWKGSGKNLTYRDPHTGEVFIPHVIEPAAGVERIVLAILCEAFDMDQVEGQPRIVLRLHPRLAPIKCGVFPLTKDPSLTSCAKDVFSLINGKHEAMFDQTDSIGKRYRRMDEIGTPFCVTIDQETLDSGAVTLRHRDSMRQDRMAPDEVLALMDEEIAPHA